MRRRTDRPARSSRASLLLAAAVAAAAVALAAPGGPLPAAGSAPAADVRTTGSALTAALRLVGRHDLGGGGLNGEVVTLGSTAFVGAGLVPDTGDHTERYNPAPCVAVTVKVVDLTDPRAPKVAATIPVPLGVAAIDLDVLRVATPSFTGDLLAVALDDGPSHQGPTRCVPTSAVNHRGVSYYDVTNPAAPAFLGRYEADADLAPANAPACGVGNSTARCAVGQHSVHLVQRADGKVLSVSSEPLASHPVVNAAAGDLRIVDVTNPRQPTQVGAWPPVGPQRPSPFSNNGCRRFSNNHQTITDEAGTTAHVAYMDDGLINLDISNPAAITKIGQFDYPAERAVEGNAAFVTTGEAGGRKLALLSEEDFIPSSTTVRIDTPAAAAGSRFACEAMFTVFDPEDVAQIWHRPGFQVSGQIVYAGRGCPARVSGGVNVAQDPYLANAAGKIVVVDGLKVAATQPNIPTASCGFTPKVLRAQAEGAIGVIVAHKFSAPFQASPFGISSGGDHTGVELPTVTIDEAEGDALRAVMCPSIDGGGNCVNPPNVTGAMVDQPGDWGGLRVLDMADPAAPKTLSVFRSPGTTVFPPPDLGVYTVGHTVLRGNLAFAAWNADGLRVVDLSDPTKPVEVASFKPGDSPDPTKFLPAKAQVVGVDLIPGFVVVSDVNSGLYVLEMGGGYWTAASDGGVFAFGAADFHGSMGGTRLTRPVVGVAASPTGTGYWLVASDGGVFAFGSARFAGSTGAMRLNRPVVAMAPTPSGKGYWLVASDGGVFAFGDAGFHGSAGAMSLTSPVVGMAPTASGRGYWLVAADGGVFAFGDAAFKGSTGNLRLNRPVVALAPTPSGSYWLVAADGGVFAFGGAPFLGSVGGSRLNAPVVGAQAAASGKGYWMVGADGGTYAFGDSSFLGSTGGTRLNSPVVGIAAAPR